MQRIDKPTVKELMDLLEDESHIEALAYFNKHKEYLIKKKKHVYGEELLTAFYELQLSLAPENDDLNAYRATINFYYDNRLLLTQIDIKENARFKIFQKTTKLNERVENMLHLTLAEISQNLLNTDKAKFLAPSMQVLLETIKFAEDLLEKSLAKLSIEPDYKKMREKLAAANASAQHASTTALIQQALTTKPAPPSLNSIPTVKKQLAHKTSAATTAQPLKKRILSRIRADEDEDENGHTKLPRADENTGSNSPAPKS